MVKRSKLSAKDAEKLRRRLEARAKEMKWSARPPNVELDPDDEE